MAQLFSTITSSPFVRLAFDGNGRCRLPWTAASERRTPRLKSRQLCLDSWSGDLRLARGEWWVSAQNRCRCLRFTQPSVSRPRHTNSCAKQTGTLVALRNVLSHGLLGSRRWLKYRAKRNGSPMWLKSKTPHFASYLRLRSHWLVIAIT